MRRITYNKFMAWLDQYDDNTLVGYNAIAYDCPVANFYKDTYDVDGVFVTTRAIQYVNRRNYVIEQKLPKWASHMVAMVTMAWDDLEHPVTAGMARQFARKAYNG